MITGIFENITFEGISIDTRTVKPGNLFVAIAGEKYDGHDFVEEAFQKGAAGAVVSRTATYTDTALPVIPVKNTIETLGKITQHWRKNFRMPVIGLTGSNGKTTTKNMLGAILKETQKPVLVTQGNFNNHIGVPLMLAQLSEEHHFAVIEMGMNHFEEIAYLSRLTRPTTVLITNAAPCHLAGVDGTIAGVAKAKGEIFEGLSPSGIAVINADDDFAEYWKELIKAKHKSHKIITYGIYGIEKKEQADVTGELKDDGFILHYHQQQIFIRLNLLGKHNISNALGAAAVSLANGINLVQIKAGLEKLQAEHGRLEIKYGKNGVTIIDDTYNANPLSLKAAIDAISHYKQQKILVLADMRELGEQSISLHRECGKFARAQGIDKLLAMGELTQYTVKSFGENAWHFADHHSLAEALKDYLQENNVILIKGSRSMKMENVVQAIL